MQKINSNKIYFYYKYSSNRDLYNNFFGMQNSEIIAGYIINIIQNLFEDLGQRLILGNFVFGKHLP